MNSLTNLYHDSDISRIVQSLMPGEFGVATNQGVLMTVLGSCVAVYLSDNELEIGGLNHFMLPDLPKSMVNNRPEIDSLMANNYHLKAGRYGVSAMELLINELLKMGARKDKLVDKVFGGAKVIDSNIDIGASNVAFAFSYLKNENIPIESHCVGGTNALKLYAYADTGTVFVRKINGEQATQCQNDESRFALGLHNKSLVGALSIFDSKI